MKHIWILSFLLAVPLFAETDILKELEAAKQAKADSAEKLSACEIRLSTLKLAIRNQQNVVRQKKLILEDKDPAIVGREIREAASRKTVLWDYPLKDKKNLLGNNGFPPGVSFVKDGDRDVLSMASAEMTNKACIVKFFNAKDLEAVRGKKIELTIMAKGKNLKGCANFKIWTTRPKPYNDMWPEAHLGEGSFDWRKATFTTEIPQNAGSVALILGLSSGSGEVWYKDLKIEIFPGAE